MADIGTQRNILSGSCAVVIVAAVAVIAFALGSHHHSPSPGGSPPTAAAESEPLRQIMHPAGLAAVGTDCVTASTYNLNKATLTARIFCPTTSQHGTVVWGYQFDSQADYRAGLALINGYTGFRAADSVATCPPTSRHRFGLVGWHANSNAEYAHRPGQNLECFIDAGKPLLIWSMPTMDTFFVGQDNTPGTAVSTILAWWKTLDYG